MSELVTPALSSVLTLATLYRSSVIPRNASVCWYIVSLDGDSIWLRRPMGATRRAAWFPRLTSQLSLVQGYGKMSGIT